MSKQERNISNAQLSFGEWWYYNREEVRLVFWRAGWGMFFILLFICIGIWGWYAYQMISFERSMVGITAEGTVPYRTIALRRPEMVSLGAVRSIPTYSESIIVYAPISNPNQHFIAHVTFEPTINGEVRDVREAIVLPGQDTYISLLEQTNARSARASIAVTDIRWERVREKIFWPFTFSTNVESVIPIEIPIQEIPEEVTEETADEVFEENSETVEKRLEGYIVNFTYKHTAFATLLNAPVKMVAKQNGRVVGMQNARIPKTEPRMEKHMRVNWNTDIPEDVDIEIIPDFNAYEPDYYLTR